MNNNDTKYLKDLIIDSGLETSLTKKFSDFIDFLLTKNTELNVISRKLETQTILLEHLYDCIAGFSYFEQYNTITDLGTGGGFPGLLLSIAFHNKKINLVEKSPKKAEYLKSAITHLRLKNTSIFNIVVPEFNSQTDVFTCRGFKPINEIIDMTQSYFNKGTKYLLYKGKMETINDELEITSKKYNIHYEIQKIAKKITEKERHLVIVYKKN